MYQSGHPCALRFVTITRLHSLSLYPTGFFLTDLRCRRWRSHHCRLFLPRAATAVGARNLAATDWSSRLTEPREEGRERVASTNLSAERRVGMVHVLPCMRGFNFSLS